MSEVRIAVKCICCESFNLLRSPAILMPFLTKRIFGYEPIMITPEWGLRDIQQGMAYQICNSLQCQDCGVLFSDIRFSNEEMSRLYSGYRDKDYSDTRERFEPGYMRVAESYCIPGSYVEKVESFLKPYLPVDFTILDWGGDTGINTPLRLDAQSTDIYDISEKEVIDGVRKVSLAEALTKQYDLIVCSQVLEHVSYPLNILEQISPLMHQKTFLYVEVPFEGLMRECGLRFDAYKLKHHWHEHINFFTADAILKMLLKFKLDVIEIKEIPISLQWRDSYIISVLCKRIQSA